jgi:hypothetical protein
MPVFKGLIDNSIKTTNTVDGLSGQFQLFHSAALKKQW